MRSNKSFTLILLSITLLIAPYCSAKIKTASFPIQHWVTKRGVQVYFLPAPQLPMVDIRVAFAAGAARDGEHLGLASLTNTLLNQGTRQQDANQIASGFERVGAIYESEVARDMAIVSLRSLTDKKLFDPALALLTEVLTQANFPAKAFRREQNNQLMAIQGELQSPAAIASNRFYAALYGAHPYGHNILGTSQSVRQLSPQLAKTFYHRYYNAQNATVAIVGDINRQQAETIANKLSHGLVIGRKAPPLENMPPLAQGVEQVIPYPAQQTNIRLGQVGISRDSVDYFPLIVGNYTLGGGSLVSRLFDEVREKRGLSYSAYSRFIPMAAKGPFVISLGTRNQQAQQALTVTQNVLHNFVKHGPTAAELSAAKKNINGSFALSLDSNRALADTLLAIGFYQLPLTYLDTYQKNVLAVTREQVRKAFQRHLHPDKMVVIRVGDHSLNHMTSTRHAKKI